jgi:hypothetical protein
VPPNGQNAVENGHTVPKGQRRIGVCKVVASDHNLALELLPLGVKVVKHGQNSEVVCNTIPRRHIM